jgi:hypothetical protein
MLSVFCVASLRCRLRSPLTVVGVLLFMAAVGCGSSGSSGGGSTAPVTPGFSLAVSSASVSVNAGGTQTFSVYIQPTNGFDSSVAVSLSGLPAGVTASPSSFSLQGAATQVVTLTAAAAAPSVSNAAIGLAGSSGSLSSSANLSVSVLSPTGFTITAPSSVTLIPGTSQTISLSVTGLSGFTNEVTISVSGLPSGVTVSPTPPLYGNPGLLTQLTLITSSSATGSGTITFSGVSGSLSAQAQTTVAVSTAPDFLVTTDNFTGLPINAGSSGGFDVSATGYNGFNSAISVAITGLPSGVTASPASFSILPGQTQPVTVTVPLSSAVSQTNFTVHGTSGTLMDQTQVQLDITAPYLNLETEPTAITIPAGSSSQTFLTVILAPNSTGNVPITISGLPAGVTVSPASVNVSAPGGEIPVYFEAASSGAKGGTVTFRGTYGSATGSATVTISIGPAQTDTAVPIKSRSKYIRSDSTLEYSGYPPPNWSVYDSANNRFFASDANTNHVNVFDATTEKQIATLVVPGAFGMDMAPDNSVLYVGTLAGDLYVVDPVNLVVTQRYPSNTISDYGFSANAVFALANGKLLLERYFLVPGYSWVDGNGPLALWNPVDNSIEEFLEASDGLMPEGSTCLQTFEYGVLTNNRTRILLTPVLTSEGSSILCSFDPNADTWVWSPTITDGDGSALATLAVSPDGNTVAAFDGTKIYVLNAATLQIENSFAVALGQELFNYPSMAIGTDNQTVYISGGQNFQFLYAYSLTTGAQVGWMPEVQVMPEASYTPTAPYMQGISSNGLIGGVMEQGFGLLDATALNPLPVGSAFSTASLTPGWGPAAGATTTSWLTGQSSASSMEPPLGSVYFGGSAAMGVSVASGTMYANTPSGSPGPVDVITTTTDGGEQILPEGFSYGPWVLEAPTSYATAEGGGPAQVYGYGYGRSYVPDLSAQIVAPPSDLALAVGGNAAQVTGYLPGPYSMDNFFYLPFPLEGAEFTVPPGTAGTTVNLTVSNSSGSTTVANGFTYLPQIQVFSVDGQLTDGVYDPVRDVYYLTDTTEIRVFSRTKGAWLSPIPISGAVSLFGIAMSPDASKIVVSDAGAYALYVINPESPSSIQRYPFGNQIGTGANTETPAGVAITNGGQMYFAAFDQNGDGSAFLLNLDPNTGTISGVAGQTEGDYPYGRVPMSADGSRVYFNGSGQVGYVNTSTGAVTSCTGCGDLGQDGYEVVLSANQTSLYADGFMMDSDLNIEGLQALNWRESFDADYVYGAAISPDGSLLFQPGSQSIDIFDGRTGAFQARVSLSVPLSPNYRALIGDGKDNVLLAITGETGDGIAVIDLSTIPEPNPLPYARLFPPAKFNVGRASSSAVRDSQRAAPTEALAPPFASPRPRIQHRTRKFVAPGLRHSYASAGAQLSQ